MNAAVAETLADKIELGAKFDDVRAIATSAGDVRYGGVSDVTMGPILDVFNPTGYSLRDAVGLVSVKYVFDRRERLVTVTCPLPPYQSNVGSPGLKG